MFDYSYTTLTLKDAINYDNTLLDNLNMDTNERTQKFKEMFMAMYRMKSIGAETVELFKIWIEDVFNQFKDYYIKKLDVYEDNFDYRLGITKNKYINTKMHNAKNSSYSNTGNTQTDYNTNIKNTGDNENKTYSLPNRQTSAENVKGYLTAEQDNSIDENEQKTGFDKTAISGSNDGTELTDNTNNITETSTGDVNNIEQHEKMNDYIKNLYMDFCKEFKECFALVYA